METTFHILTDQEIRQDHSNNRNHNQSINSSAQKQVKVTIINTNNPRYHKKALLNLVSSQEQKYIYKY